MKLKRWLEVMLTTKTIDGPILYFQRVYFLHTFCTVLIRLHLPKSKSFRQYIEKIFDKEIVIKNTLGVFMINLKNDSVTKSITSFEIEHQNWLEEDTRKKIFIDIGANIGFYSILALHKFAYTQAFAFEPNPETYQRLSKNIELNNLQEKITAFQYGLSETKETAILGTRAVHTGASSFVKSSKEGFDEVTVETKPFDSCVLENNISIENISFIKIDVEGYELQVLKGMKESLKKFEIGTCLFIEIHPRSAGAAATKKDTLRK